MPEERTKFDYLLNAFEAASQSHRPAENGYAEKRKALFDYVRGLENGHVIVDAPLGGGVRAVVTMRGRPFRTFHLNALIDHLQLIKSNIT